MSRHRSGSSLEGTAQPVGYIFHDSSENKKRYQCWIRFVRKDNIIAVAINALMAMVMCWFAWATLLPHGEVPTGWRISIAQASFFEVSMGAFGRIAFLLIAASFLCDNWIGIVDACARMHADFLRSTFRFAQNYSGDTLYRIFFVGLVVISCLTIPLAPPGPLLLIGGVLNFIAMPIYCPVLIYMNFKLLPRIFPAWVRPKPISLIMAFFVSAAYAVIAIWYFVVLFAK